MRDGRGGVDEGVDHFRSIAANMISHISINLPIIADVDVDDRPGCALGAFPLV